MSTPTINHPALWQHLLPWPDANSHKYNRGSAMIVGGYPLTGAARLSALACARAGAGLTHIICPQQAFIVYASSLLSVLVKPFANDAEFSAQIENPLVHAYLIGPGAGVEASTQQKVLTVLAQKKPTVLDADALSAFENKSSDLFDAIQAPCVLTPHEGEFKRLFALTQDRVASAQTAAKQSKTVIVLKGNTTVIASPDGRCILNEGAPATLATGGSGDVLAGIITSLLAQSMPTFEASAAAVWMHSEAARLFGCGLIAEDLVEMLPTVLSGLAPQH